jgi:hypothetical protein
MKHFTLCEDPAIAEKSAFETHSHDHMTFLVKRSAHGIIAVRDDQAIGKLIPEIPKCSHSRMSLK